MSDETSPTNTLSAEESTSCVRKISGSSDSDVLDRFSKSKKKRQTEAEKLRETSEHLDIDADLLHSGFRLLRSHKTLQAPDEDQAIRQQFEHDNLIEDEISLRPRRAGQTTTEKHYPTRRDFEYIYKNIDELDCQVWAENLEPWLHFVKTNNLIETDPSLPILDKNGTEYPNLEYSLETLIKIPANKTYLKIQKDKETDDRQTDAIQPHTSSKSPLPDNNSSSSPSTSFVVIPHTNPLALNSSIENDLQSSNPHSSPVTTPEHTGNVVGSTPTNSPQGTATISLESRPSTPDSDFDDNMATLRERSIFFPSEKFDGRNKALSKQHWQAFEDFCDQQKLYIIDHGEGADAVPATPIDQIKPFFQMTLTDLARAWLDRTTFTSAKDLKDKFLTDFSPYGKTHRQWISKWTDLKFDPNIDNIDEFLEKFDDLAKLNNFQPDYKLQAFKILMPKEIELHLRTVDNLQDCYQTAKELLTIVHNPITNKMSTLSLAQSRSPSPQPRSRSPSPNRFTPPATDRSRPRTNPSIQGFRQYPEQNRPQPILKRPFRNTINRGRGRPFRGRAPSRPRSLSRNRSFSDRCFNCNMVGHIAKNCFTRTRTQSQNRFNFPKRFTPNYRKNQRGINQRYQQPRVRFQDQNTNRYEKRNGNRYRYSTEYMGPYADEFETNERQDQYPEYHLN